MLLVPKRRRSFAWALVESPILVLQFDSLLDSLNLQMLQTVVLLQFVRPGCATCPGHLDFEHVNWKLCSCLTEVHRFHSSVL